MHTNDGNEFLEKRAEGIRHLDLLPLRKGEAKSLTSKCAEHSRKTFVSSSADLSRRRSPQRPKEDSWLKKEGTT